MLWRTDVLFQDIREVDTYLCGGRHFIISPDIKADFRSMPYPDNTFRLVVFDPPHLMRNVKGCSFDDIYSENGTAVPIGWQEIKYGSLGNEDWKETLRLGFKECFRVLVPGGFLIFKWNDTDKPVSEILKLTEQKPILGHLSGKRSNTHWILFMKDDLL